MKQNTYLGPPSRGPFLSPVQTEERHGGARGKLRRWIFAADHGDPEFIDLRSAITRIGRAVLIDEARFVDWLTSRAAKAQAPARNPHGRAGKPSNDAE